MRPDDVVIFQEFCAFQGAKLRGCFRESGSACGASFCPRCGSLQGTSWRLVPRKESRTRIVGLAEPRRNGIEPSGSHGVGGCAQRFRPIAQRLLGHRQHRHAWRRRLENSPPASPGHPDCDCFIASQSRRSKQSIPPRHAGTAANPLGIHGAQIASSGSIAPFLKCRPFTPPSFWQMASLTGHHCLFS